MSFEKNCVRGIQANRKRIEQLLHEVMVHLTRTLAYIFYARCIANFSAFCPVSDVGDIFEPCK